MKNDPELVKSFSIICAAEATGILPDELLIPTKCRKVAHARFLAMACMSKFSDITQKQIAGAFGDFLHRDGVATGVKAVRDDILLFNKYGITSELLRKYKVCEKMMRGEFKVRYWANVPDIEFRCK